MKMLYDGYLYYNTYDKICRFSPDTMESEVVYEPDISEGYVYGIRIVELRLNILSSSHIRMRE